MIRAVARARAHSPRSWNETTRGMELAGRDGRYGGRDRWCNRACLKQQFGATRNWAQLPFQLFALLLCSAFWRYNTDLAWKRKPGVKRRGPLTGALVIGSSLQS